MKEDWSLGMVQPSQIGAALSEAPTRPHSSSEKRSPTPASEGRAMPLLLQMLTDMMERAEERYMMVSGQLDHLSLALDAHQIGPYADPQGHIVNRLVKPHPNLAEDLDPNTQLKLLAWLYRLHDPRLERSLATQRALNALGGNEGTAGSR
jgi:hypothetical protein